MFSLYLKSVFEELKKISWIKTSDIYSIFLVVMLSIALFSVFFGLLDVLISVIFAYFFNL